MSSKIVILEDLGETALLLPQLINRALSANDRVKYFLTLFQSARDHADHPRSDLSSLQREREAAGVDDVSLDSVVSAGTRDGNSVVVPQAARIHACVLDGLREMLQPITVAAGTDPTAIQAYEAYQQRFDRLSASAPSLEHDRVPREYIEAMTHGRHDHEDSLHVLVMGLHQELNRLQRRVASETLDGANVYGIAENDRPLVAAFMAGVNATAPLKFDHPGLAAGARGRDGSRQPGIRQMSRVRSTRSLPSSTSPMSANERSRQP
jgi:hypothetical protein